MFNELMAQTFYSFLVSSGRLSTQTPRRILTPHSHSLSFTLCFCFLTGARKHMFKELMAQTFYSFRLVVCLGRHRVAGAPSKPMRTRLPPPPPPIVHAIEGTLCNAYMSLMLTVVSWLYIQISLLLSTIFLLFNALQALV
jgi:hypothetical protein